LEFEVALLISYAHLAHNSEHMCISHATSLYSHSKCAHKSAYVFLSLFFFIHDKIEIIKNELYAKALKVLYHNDTFSKCQKNILCK